MESATNTGWMCPRCKKINAPSVLSCSCQPEQETPTRVTPQGFKWIEEFEHNRRPDPRCTCHAPLFLYVPPEGTYITCPVHGKRFVKPAVRFTL